MFNKASFLLILIITLFTNCSDKESNQTFKLFKKKGVVKGNQIISEQLFIADPIKLLGYKDKLVIVDRNSENVVTVLNISDFSICNKFGKIGRGPDEIKYLGDSWINEKNGKIELFDLRTNTIHSVLFNEKISSKNAQKITFNYNIDNVSPLIVSKMIRLHDSCYIGTGLFGKGRFLLINKEKENVEIYSDFGMYNSEYNKMSNLQRCMAIQGNFLKQPDSNRFAFITGSITNSIQIHDLQDDIPTYINHFILDWYFPKVVGGTPAVDSKKPFGFLSSCCSKDRIFVLYSNKTFHEYGNAAAMSNIVLSFDWDGKPLDVFTLDKEVLKIGHIKTNSLIGVSIHGGTTQLIEFNI